MGCFGTSLWEKSIGETCEDVWDLLGRIYGGNLSVRRMRMCGTSLLDEEPLSEETIRVEVYIKRV